MTNQGVTSDELTGLAGFAPADLTDDSSPCLILWYKPNDSSVRFQVKREDIIQIIPGPIEDGQQLLQVLLRPGSVVETQIEMLHSVRNLQDPTLKHLTATAISTVSSLPSN